VKAFVKKYKNPAFDGHLMRQCFSSILPMQLGILQMLLNSSEIRSHSSEVGSAINIDCSIFQMLFIIFFLTREEYPKDAMDSPVARYLKQFFFFQIPRNLRKSGEPAWLRLAQGLLLSPPSLYGDRLTIGYLQLGERTIRAFVLSLASGNVTLC
jgi:hypothetical protein